MVEVGFVWADRLENPRYYDSSMPSLVTEPGRKGVEGWALRGQSPEGGVRCRSLQMLSFACM